MASEISDDRYGSGGGNTGERAHEAAQQAQRKRFNQKLQTDVARFSADGNADADFTGSLRSAHQHEVHDADTADDK